jgi:hypothetical protein
MRYITPERIRNKVAEELGLTPEEISQQKKTAQLSQARYAFMLIASLLGADLGRAKALVSDGMTSPMYFVDKAIDLYKVDADFRGHIHTILKHYDNDTLVEFASRYAYATTPIKQRENPYEVIKRKDNERIKRIKESLPNDWSDKEKEMYVRACDSAEEFFEKYGKGHEPDHILMVNKKKYLR